MKATTRDGIPMDDWDDAVLSQSMYILRGIRGGAHNFSNLFPVLVEALGRLERAGLIRVVRQGGQTFAWRVGR